MVDSHASAATGTNANAATASAAALLTLDQAVALARYATDRAALTEIVDRLPVTLRERGLAAAESVAPLRDDPHTEGILGKGGSGLAYHLFKDASTEGAAARLLDWVAEHSWLRLVTQQAATLARKFPGALTSERTDRLAKACLAAGVVDLGPDLLVSLLLEKDAFSSDDMLTLYKKSFTDTNKSVQVLITHKRATPKLWMAVASRALPDGPLTGQTWERYLGEMEDLRILMRHPPAMAVPEVGDILLERTDLVNSFGGMAAYLRYLTPKLPPGFAFERGHVERIVEQLFGGDTALALETIEPLPAEWRRCVSRDRIIELAATHPDSRVRQAVILFKGRVGDEVRPARKTKQAQKKTKPPQQG